MHPQCQYTSRDSNIINAKFAPKSKIEEILGIPLSETYVMLCKDHYNDCYRAYNPSAQCASCNAWPKTGTSFINHCPNAELVAAYLNYDVPLTSSDLLCKSCYNIHTSIIKSFETHPEMVNSRLMEYINDWEAEITCDATTHLTRAVLSAVVAVAKCFTQDKALLLSDASEVFLSAYCDKSNVTNSVSNTNVILETENGITKFTPRWLLYQLILHLKNH